MKPQKQKVVDKNIGDCFRACMASLLELPIDVCPNDHSEWWHEGWQRFLGQFGLTLSPDVNSKGPIWMQQPWIASVKSLNFPDVTHSILMEGSSVLFDPSTKKIYKKGQFLSSKEVVSGIHLEVKDVSKLHKLKEYRDRIAKDNSHE